MPRPRPLRKQEDIAAIPSDEPVTIDLTEEAQVVVAAEPDIVVVEKISPPEEEENPFKKQLADMAAAQKLAEQNAASERTRRETAEQQARERAEELKLARDRGDQAEYDAVVSALGAEQANAEKAQADLETAFSIGDGKAVAEAQRRLSRAEANLVRLEDGKTAFEARREERKVEKSPEPRPQERSLPRVAQDWIEAHPEYKTGAKNREIGLVHQMVVEIDGKSEFSPEYFAALERRLGIQQLDPDDEPEPEPQPKPQRRSAPVSAPVSRDAPSLSNGQARPRQITLTPQQREAAKISGVSEVEYARNLVKLNGLKDQGHYQERG